jgi:hypothetical protein
LDADFTVSRKRLNVVVGVVPACAPLEVAFTVDKKIWARLVLPDEEEGEGLAEMVMDRVPGRTKDGKMFEQPGKRKAMKAS